MAEQQQFKAGDRVRIRKDAAIKDVRGRILQDERAVGEICEINTALMFPVRVNWRRFTDVFRGHELELAPEGTTPDRETLGRLVREVWVAYCIEMGDDKPSHLTSWGKLSESDKEVDRRIGEAIAQHVTVTPSADTAAELARTQAALESIVAFAKERIEHYYISRAIEDWHNVLNVATKALAQGGENG